MRFVSLTEIMLGLLLFVTRCRGAAVALCAFVNAAFHTVLLADATSVQRICARKGWSLLTFHVGNVALHWVPFGATLRTSVTTVDKCVATAVTLLWFTLYGGPYHVVCRHYAPVSRRACALAYGSGALALALR